jgi:hypothetical protein
LDIDDYVRGTRKQNGGSDSAENKTDRSHICVL